MCISALWEQFLVSFTSWASLRLTIGSGCSLVAAGWQIFVSFLSALKVQMGFPGISDDKESACNAGDPGSISGLGRFCRVRNGNALQNSCLENPMNRGARWATVHGVTKSQTWQSDTHFTLGLRNSQWRAAIADDCDVLVYSVLSMIIQG